MIDRTAVLLKTCCRSSPLLSKYYFKQYFEEHQGVCMHAHVHVRVVVSARRLLPPPPSSSLLLSPPPSSSLLFFSASCAPTSFAKPRPTFLLFACPSPSQLQPLQIRRYVIASTDGRGCVYAATLACCFGWLFPLPSLSLPTPHRLFSSKTRSALKPSCWSRPSAPCESKRTPCLVCEWVREWVDG